MEDSHLLSRKDELSSISLPLSPSSTSTFQKITISSTTTTTTTTTATTTTRAWNEDLTPSRFILQAVALSLCFSVVEASLIVVLGVEASLNKHLGEVTSGILYVLFAVGQIPGPAILAVLGSKKSLILGLSCYCLYIAANVYPSWATLVPGAVLTGLGGGFLWNSALNIIHRNAAWYARAKGVPVKRALGIFNGIFVGTFQVANVTGQLASSLVLSHGHLGQSHSDPSTSTIRIMFGLFTLLSIVATAFTLLLPDTPRVPAYPARLSNASSILSSEGVEVEDEGMDEQGRSSPAPALDEDLPEVVRRRQSEAGNSSSSSSEYRLSNWERIRLHTSEMLYLTRDSRMICLSLSNISFGLLQGFQFGAFASRIISDAVGVSNVGTLGSISASIGALVSLPFGYLSDRVGRGWVMVIGAIGHGLPVLLLLIWGGSVPSSSSGSVWGLLILCTGLFGMGNAVWNGTNAAVFGDFFAQHTEAAFANLKMFSGAATAVAYFVFPLSSTMLQLAILMVIVPVGLTGYFAARWIHVK